VPGLPGLWQPSEFPQVPKQQRALHGGGEGVPQLKAHHPQAEQVDLFLFRCRGRGTASCVSRTLRRQYLLSGS
jgi:hypothetical protein